MLAGIDALVWAAALFAITGIRYDPHVTVDGAGLLAASATAAVLQPLFGWFAGVYRRRWSPASADETVALALVCLAVGSVLFVELLFTEPSWSRRSVPVGATFLAVFAMVSYRMIIRRGVVRSRYTGSGEPIVVVGAGNAGLGIVQTLVEDPHSPFRPVALVDDDPLKSELRAHGVRVLGSLADLPSVVADTGASRVLFAIPSGSIDLLREADHLARQAGVPLMVLPPVRDLFSMPMLQDIRPVTDSDLLGRPTADIDTAAVAHYITGKRVLVTGAGGSIGSELCRQLARFEPASLVMLDRDESLLAEVQLSIEGRALLDTPRLVLADIRDHQRIAEVFLEHQPQVVFHAAALKHLTMLERQPSEAWKTNVMGTHHVLMAARAVGVERFVNISTDKAADPVSVLGSSKRVAERITAHVGDGAEGAFVSVRFGNVLGSRGSVLTIFRAQAEAGMPLTVTDDEATRYFMTVHEAVRLTIYAGAIGTSGEVLVLDMGEPVRIIDVARRFAQLHSPELPIVVTGLRPGEKLHEDLLGAGEIDVRPKHPSISHVQVPVLGIDEVKAQYQSAGDEVPATLARLATSPAQLSH
ncbi:MAG: hypothetical protein RI958_670 [Actinomycetota bacterium]